MPQGMQIEVETVDLDNQSADEPMRTKRWLFNVRSFFPSNYPHDSIYKMFWKLFLFIKDCFKMVLFLFNNRVAAQKLSARATFAVLLESGVLLSSRSTSHVTLWLVNALM